MIHALSEAGLRALCEAAAQPLLYAFDFDGTLAPISADRDAVTVSPSTLESLSDLAKRAPCAIVSGRALADVATRINGTVPHVLGNHGIESPLTARSVLVKAEQICEDWKRQLLTGLAAIRSKEPGAGPAPGMEIEDKRYSLTVHFRGAQNAIDAGREALTLLRRLTPEPELIEGKYAINALPPGLGGKGPAAFAFMNHLGRTGLFYIGDEDTDETVFSLPNAVAMGIRVGRQAGSRAEFYLQDQTEVEQVLRVLVQCMDLSAPPLT